MLKSHCFDRAVIFAYNNLFKNRYRETEDYLLIEQSKRDLIYLFNQDFDYEVILKRNSIIYSEVQKEGFKKWKEIVYDLDKIFENPDKQIRRGMNLFQRHRIRIEDYISGNNEIYEDWKNFKKNDKKVFQITFNPDRYKRSQELQGIQGLKLYQKIFYVDDESYGIIVFNLNEDIAFELSFVSKFFDKNLHFINDLNECIIIYCFYDLRKNYGIKIINVGTDAGIKGLKFFKKQIDYKENIVFVKNIKRDKNLTLF